MKIVNTKNILFVLITLSVSTLFAYGQTKLDVPDIEYLSLIHI